MTIEFGQLILEDFGPFERLEFNLRQRGLFFIRGQNEDTTGADSNGSGKSHLFKGASWVLFGETPEGDKTDKLTRNGQPAVSGSVSWTDDNGEWKVTRAKRRNASMELMFEHNDQEIGAPTIAATQAEIMKALGMDFATWRNTVLYAQGDVVRFADPGTPDSERKLILKRILRLDILDKAHEQAKGKIKFIGSDLANLNLELSKIQAEQAGIEVTDDLQAQLEQAETEIKELEAKAKKIPKLRQAQAKIIEVITEISERMDEAESAWAEATNEGKSAAAARAEAAAHARDVVNAKAALAQFAAGKCPTCGSTTSTPGVKAHLRTLQGNLVAAETAQAEATERATTCERLAVKAKARGDAIKAEVNQEAAQWRAKQTDFQRDINMAEQAGVQAITAKRRADNIRQKLKAVGDRKSALEARAAEIRATYEEQAEEIRHLEFWLKGFSNTGVASYMMDSVMPELTQRANHYLQLLADGDISINFDTQSKLKSGEAREKLSISWMIEGEKDTTPSGGQRKKISIAVDLALMDLVAARERSAVDLLLMDEMLDGLDATGRNRVMALLAELRQKRSTIVVVSHDSSIAELFEHSAVVTKSGKKAVLVEEE